jgi:hypothetical protein
MELSTNSWQLPHLALTMSHCQYLNSRFTTSVTNNYLILKIPSQQIEYFKKCFIFLHQKNFFREKYLSFFSACLKKKKKIVKHTIQLVGNPEKLIRIPIKFQYWKLPEFQTFPSIKQYWAISELVLIYSKVTITWCARSKLRKWKNFFLEPDVSLITLVFQVMNWAVH